MKFYIYNLFKGKKVVKQLVTWNEIKLFAEELFNEKTKEYNRLAFESKDSKTKERYLKIEWAYETATNTEYRLMNALKSLGYEVVQREIKLDLLPKLSATENYFKFNNVPKKLEYGNKSYENHNKYIIKLKGKDKMLRDNCSPYYIKKDKKEHTLNLLK